jgi:hypothetical protein
MRFKSCLVLILSNDSLIDCVTYLHGPPPISCMHLIYNAACSLFAGVMLLWCVHQVLHKVRVAIKRADAL